MKTEIKKIKSCLQQQENLYVCLRASEGKYVHPNPPELFFFDNGRFHFVEWVQDPEGDCISEGGFWYSDVQAFVPYGTEVFEVTQWDYDFKMGFKTPSKYQKFDLDGKIVKLNKAPVTLKVNRCNKCKWYSGESALPCAVNPIAALEGGLNCGDFGIW